MTRLDTLLAEVDKHTKHHDKVAMPTAIIKSLIRSAYSAGVDDLLNKISERNRQEAETLSIEGEQNETDR